jgi:acetolactate synthase-1/2/3 large subunit
MTEQATSRLGGSTERTGPWLGKLNGNREVWQQYQASFVTSDQMPMRPERLMHALNRALPENAIVASDVGVHHNWVIQLLETRRPRQLIHSWGFAAMGFATSGILGAKLAAPDRPCVAVVGDGSFLMTPHALATAVEYDIPVVWVVWNNYGYCSIRDLQVGLFGGRELATGFINDTTQELQSADFAMLAKAFGVQSAKIDKADALEDALDHAIRANRPYLLEVPVDREIRPIGTGSWELPPMPHPEPNFRKALQAAGFKP